MKPKGVRAAECGARDCGSVDESGDALLLSQIDNRIAEHGPRPVM